MNTALVKIKSMWVYIIFVGMVLVGISIFGKAAMLQMQPDQNAIDLALSFTSKVRDIESTRGQIWSSDGSLLATTVSEYEIRWDAKTVTDLEAFESHLDSLCLIFETFETGKSKSDYKRLMKAAMKKGARYELMARHLTFEQVNRFKQNTWVKKGSNKTGFLVKETKKRVKPYGSLASRTIGLERATDKVGLELSYDSILAGRPGKQLQELIPGNVWKPMTDAFIEEPIPGFDIVSTIDVHLQDVAEHALRKQMDSLHGEWGCAILMEVETGYVRAIANLSRTKDSSYAENFNYAVGQLCEPGSTMKLASLMAAFQEGTIDSKDTVNTGNGERNFNGVVLHDSHQGGYGSITVEQVFEKSSNVGTALAVRKSFANKPQSFLDMLQSFGLGSRLGVDIPGEAIPMLYNSVKNEKWSANSLTQMSIGYEVSMTPLQVLAFYNAVANNGNLIRPLFVQEVRKPNGVIEKKEKIVLRNNICKPDVLAQCKKMLEGVGEPGGTAEEAFRNSPFKVAGKTGTCRLWKNGNYLQNHYRASFVGYFPSDKPKYSCIVVIEDPRGVYYASKVAAPVFKELAAKIYATNLDIHGSNLVKSERPFIPTFRAGRGKDGRLLAQVMNLPLTTLDNGSEWFYPTYENDVLAMAPMNVRQGVVPNVMGMGMRDAVMALEQAGAKVKIQGHGHVVSQSINAGTSIKKGNQIQIVLQ
jgi:cell division protein FtsI (penicillin-binding protein 3)